LDTVKDSFKANIGRFPGQKTNYRSFHPESRSFPLLCRITYGMPQRLCIFVLLKRANDLILEKTETLNVEKPKNPNLRKTKESEI
jgi:hypothetical protein